MSDDEHSKVNQQPGRVSLDDFTLIKVIGKGTYGKVMLVRHKKVRVWFSFTSVTFSRTMQYMQ